MTSFRGERIACEVTQAGANLGPQLKTHAIPDGFDTRGDLKQVVERVRDQCTNYPELLAALPACPADCSIAARYHCPTGPRCANYHEAEKVLRSAAYPLAAGAYDAWDWDGTRRHHRTDGIEPQVLGEGDRERFSRAQISRVAAAARTASSRAASVIMSRFLRPLLPRKAPPTWKEACVVMPQLVTLRPLLKGHELPDDFVELATYREATDYILAHYTNCEDLIRALPACPPGCPFAAARGWPTGPQCLNYNLVTDTLRRHAMADIGSYTYGAWIKRTRQGEGGR